MSLSFKRAEQIRLELTAQQQKEIRDLYQSVADDIADRLSVPQRVPSDALRQWYLRDLQKQVNAALEEVGKTTENTIRSNAEKVAQGVVGCNADWLKSVGMPVGSAFSWVPTDIVTSVATGQIYEGPWSLSGAIWADVQTQQRDIQTIIARGIAENKSAFDIAKDLEKYVDPSAVKPWDWSKVYPGVRRQIDYSAQRLARTMVSHAYQQAFVRTTQKNPFVTKYKWEASNSDRVCELCQERDGKLFSKDDLPLDHPNGMCTYTAVIEDSMDQVADRLADWANGAEDPELEAWAKDMYGKDWESKPKTPDYSSFKDAAVGAENKYEFWMNMTEEQQNQIMTSGIDLGELFNQVKDSSSIQDWKPAAPGDSSSFSIRHDFSTHPLKFEPVQARSAGWMADATNSGLIRVREEGLGSTWDFIISHEAGHQLSNACPELQQMILMNPGNILGRYNIKQGFFDGVYGEYNPEEAFATSVSNYVRYPDSMREKYPDTYAAIDALFKASPTAEQYVRSAMTQYEERFKP